MSEARKPRAGPLAGTRVLDLTRLLPGPLAAMLLAEMGADVIKIEDPNSPDPMRTYPPFTGTESALYLSVNRSKRSIAVDYTTEAGREIIFDLARGADVLIEQFRPGHLDMLGLGYADIRRVNPKIVYISLTGYGQSGPYSARAGHDINYIGYTGLLESTGNELGPAIPGGQVADVAGSYCAVISCLAALLNRNKNGEGQKADVSMLDAALPYMIVPLARQFSGISPRGRGGNPLTGGMPCYGIYECADKRYVALGAVEEKFWKRFCEAIDSPDLLPLQYSLDDGDRVKKELAEVFKTRTRDEWMAVAADGDFCLTPVLEIDRIEHDPHLRDRGMFVEHSHPVYGTTRGIGLPIRLSETAAAGSWAAPQLGEDTVSLLRELGYGQEKIDALIDSGTVKTR